MSKAFTKDSDDAPEAPLVVDDLALPPGAKNYLTPPGLATLRDEIARMDQLTGTARRPLEPRLAALRRRLDVAEAVDPATQPRDRALFGATITVRDEVDAERRYRIVGIDEADAKRGWVSWRSPVARALLNRRVGDTVTVTTPAGHDEVEIVAIDYEAP